MKKPLPTILKKYVLTFLLFSIITTAFAQSLPVSGTIIDSTGVTLPGITVKILAGKDSATVSTDADGKYAFNSAPAKTFKLTATGIGYETYTHTYTVADDDEDEPVRLATITLKTQVNMLNTVNITAMKNPITIKPDTVEYNAASYKVRDGSVVEDVLKKLPGVEVDKDGGVVAHGKPITKIRVNGKDFFAGDPKAATQNLPADIIESIQVIDDYGDQANLTGIKTGEPVKILNITIKKNKNTGHFGRLTAGVGTDDRYNSRLFLNRFVDKQQTSVLGNYNNTAANQNGTSTERSAQVRFSDEWAKKFKFDGRYSINDNDRNTISSSLREELYSSGAITRDNRTNNTNFSTTHSTDFNLEYKPDDVNYFKLSPTFSITTSGNDNNLNFTNTRNGVTDDGLQLNNSHARSPNYGANFLFNHRFQKKGRNFSANLNFSSSDNKNEAQDLYNAQNRETELRDTIYQQINSAGGSDRFAASLSYTEPLGESTYLEANYNYNYTNNKNDRFNYRIDPYTNELMYVDSLSTAYNYQFINNRFGLNLRSVKTKYNYTIGLGVQPTILQGDFQGTHTSKHSFNFIPNGNFIYKFTSSKTLSFNYNGENRQPAFNQLQPKPDLSNPQNRVYGNPDLKPEFTNRFNLNYNQFDMQSGNSLFANLNYTTTQNNIVSNTRPVRLDDTTTTTQGRLIQETRFLNTNGFYSLNGNYAFTKPFAERKYNLTFNGGATFNNQVTFIEDDRNIVKNLVLTQGLKFRVSLDSIMDSEVSGSYSFNTSKNSLANETRPLNRNVDNWRIALDGRNYFFKDFILGYNFSKEFNKGYGSSSANPTILSTFVEYQFLKQNSGSVRLQAFDLLNENTGIERTINGNITVDSRSNRLGRYFLLTFSYRIRKFAGGSVRPGGNGGGRRGGDGSGRQGGGS